MIAVGLLLAAAAAPGRTMAQADAANLAYTKCLFASSRAASEARLSVDAFERRLATACVAEQRALERTAARVLALRGNRNAAAKAREIAEAARQQVVDSYRSALELEPQLKSVAEMCRTHPEQCRE